MIDNIGSALVSIWGNKLRSLLTLLGVVIGVSSVTTLVALGEGLKEDVSTLIQGFGTNVIVVVPGRIDSQGGYNSNPANYVSGDILTLQDAESVAQVEKVEKVTPLSLVSGTVKYGDRVSNPTLLGAYPNGLEVFQVLSLEKGRMFNSPTEGRVVVLSSTSRRELFGDEDPLGKKVMIAKQDFEVIGVLGKAKAGALGSQLDSFTMIPFDQSRELNKGQDKIIRLIAKASDDTNVQEVKKTIHRAILNNHQQEEDFTVLTQDDILEIFGQFLNLATAMVSAIAAISLIVGGIGIMNIMLVTVTERTKEIGLRKAVGATKSAILIQFLTEAVVVTLIGGLLGLGVAFLTGLVVTLRTPLTPEFSWKVIGTTGVISLAIGVVFGLWPAWRAASKDPIEALRYE